MINKIYWNIIKKEFFRFLSFCWLVIVYLIVAQNINFLKMAVSESRVMTEAITKFAIDLHRCLANSDLYVNDNLFYSPTSLTIALAMTCNGAKGNTAAEVMKVLHVDLVSSTDLNRSMRELIDTLNATSSKNNKLLTANRLFVQKSLEILKTYKKGTSEFYDEKVVQVDYIRNAEKARRKINRWVEKKTNDRIKDLIPSGMLSTATRLVLVNAIYFKSFWLEKFKYHRTFSRSFFVSQHEEIKVKMMHQEADFKYFESEDLACQVLEMPYSGLKMSMVIYLPNEINGLGKLEETIAYKNVQKSLYLLDASMAKVEVFLPRFKLTQQLDLSEILSEMGSEEMFIREKADLSGITAEPLFVSQVVQKTFVMVNEEGTEAGAVTVEFLEKCLTESQCTFKADHPFLFLIRHNDSGCILFMGRLMKPVS